MATKSPLVSSQHRERVEQRSREKFSEWCRRKEEEEEVRRRRQQELETVKVSRYIAGSAQQDLCKPGHFWNTCKHP